MSRSLIVYALAIISIAVTLTAITTQNFTEQAIFTVLTVYFASLIAYFFGRPNERKE